MGKEVLRNGTVKKSAPAKDVDDYLDAVPEEARAALEKLRATIKAAAPKAVEIISYRIPTFDYLGPLVAFSASKNHCGFHLMSPFVMNAHKDELKHYDTTTATIRFSADNPLPAALVKKLVKARIEENKAKVAPTGLCSADTASTLVGRSLWGQASKVELEFAMSDLHDVSIPLPCSQVMVVGVRPCHFHVRD